MWWRSSLDTQVRASTTFPPPGDGLVVHACELKWSSHTSLHVSTSLITWHHDLWCRHCLQIRYLEIPVWPHQKRATNERTCLGNFHHVHHPRYRPRHVPCQVWRICHTCTQTECLSPSAPYKTAITASLRVETACAGFRFVPMCMWGRTQGRNMRLFHKTTNTVKVAELLGRFLPSSLEDA